MMAPLALALFLVMFLVVFVLRTVIQKRTTGDSGIRAGVLSSPPGSLEWVAGWLLVGALIAGLAAPIVEIAGLEPITERLWLRGTGVGLAVIGIVLTFMAQLSMGDQWRVGIDPHECTDLVADGAFSIVRNPIFSALLVASFGLVLMVPNAISIAGFVILAIAIELQVRVVEEPYLRGLHGPAYATYEAKIGRFVPLLGRTRVR